MQYEIGFDPDVPCITIQVSGPARAEGFAECMTQALAHPRWRPDIATLGDMRELEISSFSTEDVRKVVELLLKLDMERLGSGKSALIVAGVLGFGLVRMWTSWWEAQGVSATRQTRVFLSPEEARSWLMGAEEAQSRGRAV